MTFRPLPARALLLPCLAALFALAGCAGGGSYEEPAKPEAAKPAPAAEPAAQAAAAPRFSAVLAKADAADGTVDKVVSKCASCSLGMAGSAEHAVQLEGYTLHACSERCAKRITEKPEEVMTSVSFTFDE